MSTNNKALEERMNSLNDESLIKIITEDFSEYEKEAIQIARHELEKRNIGIDIDNCIIQKRFEYMLKHTDTAFTDLISLKDIIISSDYASIENALFTIYPDDQKFKEEYRTFYENLLELSSDETKNVLIHIEKKLEDVDDSDVILWNIWGMDTKTGEPLDLELFKWNEWLSFYVSKNDLKEIGEENYIAHCFYKMTINGFSIEDMEQNIEMKTEESPSSFKTSESFSLYPSWTIKNIFSCYKAFLAIFGLELVLEFSKLKEYTLTAVVLELFKAFAEMNNHTALILSLSGLVFKGVLVICIFSGVLLLYKKIINHESANMGNFIQGMKSNWKKVFTAGLCLTFTIGIVLNNAKFVVTHLIPTEDMTIVYIESSIASSIGFFYTVLVIYGSIILIENGIKIKSLFSGIFKFIFSKEALKLYLILLLLSPLYQTIEVINNKYMFNLSPSSGSNLFSMLDIITSPQISNWLRLIEVFVNAFIASFILLYTSLTFYRRIGKTKLSNSSIDTDF